jgi:hypothetical protein
MSQQSTEIICRYCKGIGHYKNNCPKLTSKPVTNTYQKRPRLMNQPISKQATVTKTQVAQQPIIVKPKVDEFPVLCKTSLPIKSGWGGGKSFIDILASEPPKIEDNIKKNDISEMVLLG